MQDINDWPVAFLGALYAGVVPVAVNTLLTADDYAYMLEHSRSQAVMVSGALLPTLKLALTKSDHEVQQVIVSRPLAPLDFGEVAFDAFVQAQALWTARRHAGRRCRLLAVFVGVHRGGPRAPCTPTPTPTGRPSSYGKGVLGLRESDVCFSAAKLFFAYGLGKRAELPAKRGCHRPADGRAADAGRDLQSA